MIRINDILDVIYDLQPDADVDLVERAYIYSARVHDGQTRLSGEPYLSHPLEVAHILANMNLDVTSVAAALLHDVVEDTHATEEELTEMFGAEVSHIVAGVTKISKLPFHSSEYRQAESIRKMILAMADDIRVIMIKLADRLHNMRTLKYHSKEEKKKKIAQETMDIYAPISARLGIYWLKNELENISFETMYPDEYRNIEAFIEKGKDEQEKYVETVKGYILRQMDQANLPCEVMGRFKQPYSLYNKMQQQGLNFDDIYDIIAFRIVLENVSHCYEALGLVHSLWKPIPKKFKDYIGMPKANMYQSLHTTVIGPFGERIEVQIRTKDMDRIAKSGIAAHWSYKEGKQADDETGKTFAWIQNLVENQESSRNPEEFLENVRIDLFPDEVYVFTPQGDIKTMPKGATPVDFAYMIHTEVGDQCKGAKVNGRLVPLDYELSTGDRVEVTTSPGHTPSSDWLKFVKTVKAKSKIRYWIKNQERERSISLGREMCEKAFRKHKLNFNDLMRTPEMNAVVEFFNLKTIDDLIAHVGFGKITPLQVVRRFMPKTKSQSQEPGIINKLMGRVRKKRPSEGIKVKGLDDVLVRFGKCCQPVPGDQIIGFITQGSGVTVHIRSCVHVNNMNSDRMIDVEWTDGVKQTYPVRIQVRSMDRVGLLADITAAISHSGANILKAETEMGDDRMARAQFTITVESADQLKKVFAVIKQVKLVQRVRRVRE